MAFYSTLVAIDWSFGQYHVSGQFNGGVDSGALQKSGRMINLGTDYYQDLVAIVSRDEFKEMAGNSATLAWFNNLPSSVKFIMVHEAEWESGMGD